jgi:flagellar M-ring protein FliF
MAEPADNENQSGIRAVSKSSENDSEMLLGFNKLSLLRQIGLMVGLAASVALGLWVVLWSQQPDYQPLLNNLNNMDAEQVSNILNQNDIEFKVDPRSGVLLVKSDQIYRARIKLAAAGLPKDQNQGFELLDKPQGLGASQFMETALYRRGLEGELGRTISSFDAIKTARVHLAIPKRSVFVNDHRMSSASVFLEVYAGHELSQEQVNAIVNLVASSVPEMDKKNISVVDQQGQLLTQNDMSSDDKIASKQFAYTRKVENVLNDRVARILGPIVGSGRFRSEVSADLDFTDASQASEQYNPDSKTIRSEQISDEQRQAGTEGGVPGALSNQPPAAATAPEKATGGTGTNGNNGVTDIRKKSTKNYEVDRTVSYTKRAKGEVKRLTVAVAIDDMRKIDPATGKVTFAPWSKSELERLTLLVRNAVGYSAARGDSVNVINTPFAVKEVTPEPVVPIWKQPWVWQWAKPVFAGIVILTLILGLVRPALKSLTQTGQNLKELALAGDEDGLAELDQLGEGGMNASIGLSASDEFLLPGASEGYDRQVNALKGLIAEDPARVAQVVRQWVNVDD